MEETLMLTIQDVIDLGACPDGVLEWVAKHKRITATEEEVAAAWAGYGHSGGDYGFGDYGYGDYGFGDGYGGGYGDGGYGGYGGYRDGGIKC